MLGMALGHLLHPSAELSALRPRALSAHATEVHRRLNGRRPGHRRPSGHRRGSRRAQSSVRWAQDFRQEAQHVQDEIQRRDLQLAEDRRLREQQVGSEVRLNMEDLLTYYMYMYI